MKRQALFATLWSGTDILLRQGVQFIATLVLARLLVPADFGVIAMLAVFTGLASVLADAGLSVALIQRQDADHDDESTVFWITLLIGVAMAACMALAAPLIARFYQAPEAEPLTRYMALSIVVSAAGAIHFALLSKRLEFHKQALAGGIAAVVSGAAAIVLALRGFGVWALATQAVLMTVLTTTLLWLINPWRPATVLSRTSLRKLSGFGGFHLANSFLEVAYVRLYVVCVGRIFGAEQLGYYANADTARQMPATLLGGLISRVALPMFARAGHDPAMLRRGLQLGVRMTMLLMAPVVAAMVVLAQPLIEVLFGRQWLPAAPLLQVMALAVLLFPIHALNLQALMAQGHAGLMFRLEVAKKTLGLGFLLIGLIYGMAGIVWSQVAHSCVALVINTHYTRRFLRYGALAQFTDAAPPLLSAALAACLAMAVDARVPLSPAWRLGGLCAVGAVGYLLALVFLGRETWRDAVALVQESLR